MEKKIALSETIVWARKLEWLGIETLTKTIVNDCLDVLAKSYGDADRLRGAVNQIMTYIEKHQSDTVSAL
ncbi:MAG: hypothetical protein ACRD63_04520, partial [Pyrinomonadaceae bacterium]